MELVAEVPFDVAAGEGGAAEQDRPAVGDLAAVQLLQVFLHHQRRLDQQAGEADRVGLVLFGGLDDAGDGLLDAEVDRGEAVVAEDDVDQILADVVHVAAHGGEHDPALAGGVGLLHVRLQIGDRRFHRLGGLKHEWELHFAGAEEVADLLHRGQQQLVDDRDRGTPRQRLGQIVVQALAQAVDDAAVQALLDGELGQVGLLAAHRRALEERHERGQRVFVADPFIVD